MKPKLLDQVRLAIRLRHYSLRTEEAYVNWIRRFILFHGKRHPSEMGGKETNAFLSDLAATRNVSASTQTQALCALIFLYKVVLGKQTDWIEVAVRAKRPERLPTVLTRGETRAILGQMNGASHLAATLLYGAGLRLSECIELRVKDLDLERGEILVRDGKGRKDRVTMLPSGAKDELLRHIRTIEIDVIGYGDAGAEAFWVVEGARRTSGKPAFFAPVDLVAGGDNLAARLRSMPGFDADAFKKARAAEERGEAGRFLCWHSA